METNEFPELKVVHLNLLYSNHNFEKTIDRILEENPDFISFQETNTEWFKYLKTRLNQEYPYNSMDVKYKPYAGLAIFSKVPIKDLRLWYVENLPVLTGYLKIEYGEVHFLSTHTHSPGREWKFKSRNRHIDSVAVYLNQINAPSIVLGDFNAVPWDSKILWFSENTGLKDSRDHLAATFPSFLPLLKIPIDYVFFSDHLSCVNFKRLKQTYSDHYGIVCEFSIQNEVENYHQQALVDE